MADQTYYKAVAGITDGMVHHGDGEVFLGNEALDANFARTGGKNGDTVQFEKASKSDYDAYVNRDAVVTPLPEVVGNLPVGEASFTEAQTAADGKALKADASVSKPADGDPVPLDGDGSNVVDEATTKASTKPADTTSK